MSLALLGAGPSSPSPAAVTLLQSASAVSNGNVSDLSVNVTQPEVGHHMVLCVVADNIVDTPEDWDLLVAESDWSASYIFGHAVGVGEEITSVTITTPEPVSSLTMAVLVYAGVASPDQMASNTPGATDTVSTGTTDEVTLVPGLAVAVVGRTAAADASVTSWSNGFRGRFDVFSPAGAHNGLAVADRLYYSGGAKETTATLLSSTNGPVGLIATFTASS